MPKLAIHLFSAFRSFASAPLALILKGSTHWSRIQSQERSIVESIQLEDYFLTGLKPPPKKVFVYNLFKAYFLYLETFLKHLLFFAPFLRVFSSRPKITGLRFPWNHRCSMSYWLTFFSLYGFITEVRFGVVMVILKLRGVWSFFFYCWGDLVEWYFLNETVWYFHILCIFVDTIIWGCSSYRFQILWTDIKDEITFLVVHHGINELRRNNDLWSDLKPIINSLNRTGQTTKTCVAIHDQ